MGIYEKAEPLYREALETTWKITGENNPEYIQSLNNLAGVYYSMEEYEKAEPLYKEALELTRRVLGENNPEYIQSHQQPCGIVLLHGSV